MPNEAGIQVGRIEAYLEERRRLTSQVKNRIIEVLQLPLEEDKMDLDCPLFGSGLGLDSVDAVGLAAMIETDFGVHVEDSDISMFRSINSIVDYILRKKAELETGEEPPGLPRSTFEAAHLDGRPESGGDREEEGCLDYLALRTQVGLIEFRSATTILVEGAEADTLIDFLVAGNLTDLAVGCLLHSVVLDEKGGISAIVWLARKEEGYLVLANGQRRQSLLDCFHRYRGGKLVEIADLSDQRMTLAVIGPRAQEMIVDVVDEELLRLGYGEFEILERGPRKLFVGRYGETGEYDYRLSLPVEEAAEIREELLDSGSIYHIRDCRPEILPTLMMEMKSIDQESMIISGCSPRQVDLLWMIDFRKNDFLGREMLLRSLKEDRPHSILLVADDGCGIQRGSRITLGDLDVGFVQSALFSPVLSKTILFSYVQSPFAYPNVLFQVTGKDKRSVPATSRSAPLFLTQTVMQSFNM